MKMPSDLPAELLSELSYAPEEKPEPFVCAICSREASNRWNWSPRDYERPPICKGCEACYRVQRPRGGSFRDRREAMRLYAIAEALATEATQIEWRTKYYGRP